MPTKTEELVSLYSHCVEINIFIDMVTPEVIPEIHKKTKSLCLKGVNAF